MSQSTWDIEQLRRIRMAGVQVARERWPWKRSSPETFSCIYCHEDHPHHSGKCDWKSHTAEEAYPEQDGIYRPECKLTDGLEDGEVIADSDARMPIDKTYYTEYPIGAFTAESDSEALKKTTAMVVYRESDTPDGTPFIILRDEAHYGH